MFTPSLNGTKLTLRVEQFILVKFTAISGMGKEFIFHRQTTYIMVVGSRIECMAMVLIFSFLDKSTKASLIMDKKVVMEDADTPMEESTLVPGETIARLVWVQ